MGEIIEMKVSISVDDNVSWLNMHYDSTTGGTEALAAQSAAFAWRENCVGPLQAILSDEARVEAVYGRKMTLGSGPAWMGNEPTSVGSEVGGAISSQNCLLINFRNDEGLLKRSGRIFVSGIPKEQLSSGVIPAGAYADKIQAFADSLLTIPVNGSPPWGGELVVQQNYIDNVKQVPPNYIQIDRADYTDTLGTQHRRKGQYRGHVDPAP